MKNASPNSNRFGDSWASDHRDRLRSVEPALPEELHDRAQDLWSPLLAIADVIGAEWPERGRRAALELSAVERSDNRTAIRLLAAMKTIFEERRTERVSSEDTDRRRSSCAVWAIGNSRYRRQSMVI